MKMRRGRGAVMPYVGGAVRKLLLNSKGIYFFKEKEV